MSLVVNCLVAARRRSIFLSAPVVLMVSVSPPCSTNPYCSSFFSPSPVWMRSAPYISKPSPCLITNLPAAVPMTPSTATSSLADTSNRNSVGVNVSVAWPSNCAQRVLSNRSARTPPAIITWNPVGSGTVDAGLTPVSPVTGSTYWARYEYVTRTAWPWVGAVFRVNVLPDTVNESAPNPVPPTVTVVVVSFRTV